MVDAIRACSVGGRPLLCTEWLRRQVGNTFAAILPVFADNRVGWYQWGLVAGRTQTYFHWGSKPGTPPPAIWQHDVLHPDCGDPHCYFKSLWLGAAARLARGERTEC